MRRLQLLLCSWLIGFTILSALSGCGPVNPSNGGLGNPSSSLGEFSDLIGVENTPEVEEREVLGVFNFEELDPSLNSVDSGSSSSIVPSISVVGLGSDGTGAVFDESTNDRFEINLNFGAGFRRGDELEFGADVKIDNALSNKVRFPVISTSVDSRNQWDWGLVVLGRSVHQYYRYTSAEGRLIEVRSNALQILHERDFAVKASGFIHISIRLTATSAVLLSSNGSIEVDLSSDEGHADDEWRSIYNFGWNSFGDEFFGIIDRLSIIRKSSNP